MRCSLESLRTTLKKSKYFYSDINRDVLFNNIQTGTLEIPEYFSKESKDLVLRLLERDPAKRLVDSS